MYNVIDTIGHFTSENHVLPSIFIFDLFSEVFEIVVHPIFHLVSTHEGNQISQKISKNQFFEFFDQFRGFTIFINVSNLPRFYTHTSEMNWCWSSNGTMTV